MDFCRHFLCSFFFQGIIDACEVLEVLGIIYKNESAIQAKAWLADFSIQVLFPQILARREPSHLFEEAGEMMGKIEAEEARGLADVVTAHEQALGLVDDVVMDVADGCSSCGFVDNIAEITRRISQL